MNTENGWDYVNIYNGATFTSPRTLSMYAGTYAATGPYTTTSNNAIVTFTSDYCCTAGANPTMGVTFTVTYAFPPSPSNLPVYMATQITLTKNTIAENSNVGGASTVVGSIGSNTPSTVTYSVTPTTSFTVSGTDLLTVPGLVLDFESPTNTYVHLWVIELRPFGAPDSGRIACACLCRFGITLTACVSIGCYSVRAMCTVLHR